MPITLPGGDEASQDAGVSFKMSDRQKATEEFVNDGWLAMHPHIADVYTLGPRAILELGNMVLEMPMHESYKKSLKQALGYK